MPYNFYNNPDYQSPSTTSKTAPATPPPPQTGPTNFWQRIAQEGLQQVRALTPKVANTAVNVGKGIAQGIAQPFEDTAKQATKQFRYLSRPASTQTQRNQLLANQQKTSQTKLSLTTQNLLRSASAHGKVQANKMIAQGTPEPQVQSFLKKDVAALNKQTIKGAATGVNIASLAVGGGEGKGALTAAETGGKAVLKKAVITGAKTAGIGAVQGAASNVESNGKINPKSVAKSAAMGAATGAVLGVGGSLAGSAIRKGISSIKGETPKVSDLGGARENNALQTQIEKAHNAGDNAKAESLIQRLPDASTRDAMRSSVGLPTKETKLVLNRSTGKTERIPIAEARVEAPLKESSLSQGLNRPTKESKAPEELVNTNKEPQKGLSAKLQSKGAGNINPELAAARQGNTEFSKALRDISSKDTAANYTANSTAAKFEKLYNDFLKKGGTKEDFISQVESGKLGHESQQFWVEHYQQLGKQLKESGVLKSARNESYVPRVAKFSESKNPTGMGGLRKSGGFVKARAQLETDEFGNPNGDAYKTHAAYKAAVEKQGGKVQDNPVELLKSTTAQRLKAINHAQGLATLEKTPMRDGRAATITFDQKQGLPPGYRDYNTSLIPGRAVHPEAVKGIESLVKTSSLSSNPVEQLVSKANSVTKRLVTLNGIVHGKNFALASIREQGLKATATAFKQYPEELVNRAIQHGFVPSRAGMTNVFDEALDGKGFLGKATTVLGKIGDKQQKALFEGFGDKLGLSTYQHVEQQLLKKGLSADEAGKVAADTANRVIFSQRSTETSAMLRETSRIAFFAGKFFQSTLSIGTKALGIAKNNTLSEAAQRAEQKQAALGIARGFTYLFGAAQALNMATTGHPTWQNKDSKISPVFYVDKSTGKEYHITNFYGQIGELFNIASPKTVINKASPFLQEATRLMGNTDPYTGAQIRDTTASGPRQLAQMFANVLENMFTPLGFQMSTAQQTFKQPLSVTATKLLGYGTSTRDQNTLEKQVDKQYFATLPAGTGQAQDQQLSNAEAKARQDIKNGNTNSSNVQFVKSKLSSSAFSKFMHTGAATDTQRHFEGLPTEQKLQIIQKYSPEALKELDFSSLAKSLSGSSAKTTIQSLQSKGYTTDQIKQLMQKVGYGPQQLQQAATQAKIASRRSSMGIHPKFTNPLL